LNDLNSRTDELPSYLPEADDHASQWVWIGQIILWVHFLLLLRLPLTIRNDLKDVLPSCCRLSSYVADPILSRLTHLVLHSDEFVYNRDIALKYSFHMCDFFFLLLLSNFLSCTIAYCRGSFFWCMYYQ
jgi:hypothetical protein